MVRDVCMIKLAGVLVGDGLGLFFFQGILLAASLAVFHFQNWVDAVELDISACSQASITSFRSGI